MRKLSLIGLLLVPLIGFSQEKPKKEKDKQYVEKVNSLFSIRPYVNQNIGLLTLNYNKSQESPVIYRPATGLNIGGDIAFKFIHFNYQKNLPLLQPDLPSGFKPSHQQVGFDMGGRIFGMAMSYQKNRGFYIMNPGVIPDSLYADPNRSRFRQDMSSTTFGLDFRFTFSNKLSANALFDQSERQLKSKGAFTILIGERYHTISADSAFVPEHLRGHYVQSATLRKLWVNNVQVLPGYGYIGVAGNWNFGLFLYAGSGLQFCKYFNDTEDKLRIKFPLAGKGKAGVTYNGKFFFTKLSATVDYTSLGMKDANFRWIQSSWELAFGLRLYGKKDK